MWETFAHVRRQGRSAARGFVMPEDSAPGRLTDAAYWEQHWAVEHKFHPDRHIFDGVLRPLLPRGGNYLEIGCAPGSTMAYFHRNYGYRVCGIDFVGAALVHDTMRRWDIRDYEVIDADFLDYRFPQERLFDVVASFGFIEHFADFEGVLLRQAAYVRPSGHLIVEVPNLHGLNHVLYRLFLPQELAVHNLSAMRLGTITSPLLAHGFTIVHARYQGTCFLHFDEQNPFLARRLWLLRAVRLLKRGLAGVGLGNLPSRMFSPYILVVAQRQQA